MLPPSPLTCARIVPASQAQFAGGVLVPILWCEPFPPLRVVRLLSLLPFRTVLYCTGKVVALRI